MVSIIKILSVFLIAMLFLALPVHSQAEEKPFSQESFVFQGSELIPECYHPSLICLPDGSLACVWASGSGPLALDTSIKISYKARGESAWSVPVTVADDIGYPDNFSLLARLPQGNIRLFYATLYRAKRKAPPGENLAAWHLKYKDSRDGGQAWSGDFFLVPESDWVPCSRMIRLTNGDLILPATDISDHVSMFLVSEDKGGYWKELSRITAPAGLVDPSVTELEPGRLMSLLRPHEKGERKHLLWRTESSDNGRTWSEPLPTGLKNPGGPVELLKLANGHLLLAYNDHSLWLTPLTLAISTDGGATWQAGRNLETGKWDIRNPSLVQADDGRIHLVYVSRNIYLKHLEISESWIMEKK
ncbi:exo-alpha-sialidase [Gemmatimonadota bacterium]